MASHTRGATFSGPRGRSASRQNFPAGGSGRFSDGLPHRGGRSPYYNSRVRGGFSGRYNGKPSLRQEYRPKKQIEDQNVNIVSGSDSMKSKSFAGYGSMSDSIVESMADNFGSEGVHVDARRNVGSTGREAVVSGSDSMESKSFAGYSSVSDPIVESMADHFGSEGVHVDARRNVGNTGREAVVSGSDSMESKSFAGYSSVSDSIVESMADHFGSEGVHVDARRNVGNTGREAVVSGSDSMESKSFAGDSSVSDSIVESMADHFGSEGVHIDARKNVGNTRREAVVSGSDSMESKSFAGYSSVSDSIVESMADHFGSEGVHVDARRNVGNTGREAVDGGVDLHSDFKGKVNIASMQDEVQLPAQLGSGNQTFLKMSCADTADSEGSKNQMDVMQPFDICLPKIGTPIMLKPSLLQINREKRRGAMERDIRLRLRPGMVLLKHYLSISDQVKIIKRCRDLGLGPGGFYQPAYDDGARLHLKMMCLGRNWDPATSTYGEHRPIDDAKPPDIPYEFHELVEKSIKDSHAFLERTHDGSSKKELPWMSPNICIVNFYSTSGCLGLHQDKDESKETIRKGLPVVSFSIGDAGDFLHGEHREVERAEKTLLESGDVLIFGGESRRIFHGVSSIRPKTAPKQLEESGLRAGRLNLTFRQY